MPDLLLIARDTQSCFALQTLAHEEGFRVKLVVDLSNAFDWLDLREFEAAFIDISIPSTEQEKIGDILWRKNPLAHMVIFDLDSASTVRAPEVRLSGAELAMGPGAMDTMREVLRSLQPRGSSVADNFQVMVVEDLDSPRDIICAYIESLGFSKVTGVGSAKEALDLLSEDEKRFSCIVTDIRMPDVTGARLIEMMRHDRRYQHLPIVVLTAYGTVDCLVDCLKAGASGFLVKPPKRRDLMRELSRALRLHSEGKSPRLARPDEAEALRDLLLDRGFGS